MLPELLYGLIILYLLYLLAMLIGIFIFNHATLVAWFLERYPDAYRSGEYSTRYFTLSHYTAIHRAVPMLGPMLMAVIVSLIWKRRIAIVFFSELTNDITIVAGFVKDSFSMTSFKERSVLLICFILLLAIKIYLFATLPYQVDEVFNFVFFISKGPLHASIFSNNHVLYNIIASIWWKLGVAPILASRLTSVLAGMAIHVLLYALVKLAFNFRVALFTLMLTGLTFWTNAFSVEGYSYMLMAACWLLSIASLLLNSKERNRGYYLFTACCILGFYCSKLFLIPFMSTLMAWAILGINQGYGKETALSLLKATVSVLVASSFLYLPMLLWSGVPALFATTIQSHDFISKSPILMEIFSVMTEVNTKSYLAVSVSLLLTLIFFTRMDKRIKFILLLHATGLAALLLFILTAHVYPPSRAFIYLNILFYTTTAVAIAFVVSELKFLSFTLGRMLLMSFLLIKLWSGIHILNHGWQNEAGGLQDKDFYRRLNSCTNQILAQTPALIFTDRQDSYLNFYLRLAAMQTDVHVNFTYDDRYMEKSDVVILQNYFLTHETFIPLGEREFGVVYVKEKR